MFRLVRNQDQSKAVPLRRFNYTSTLNFPIPTATIDLFRGRLLYFFKMFPVIFLSIYFLVIIFAVFQLKTAVILSFFILLTNSEFTTFEFYLSLIHEVSPFPPLFQLLYESVQYSFIIPACV